MNFTKVIFRPIKRLKLIGSWFPLFSVLSSGEFNIESPSITIFCFVLWQWREDLMTFQIFEKNGRRSQQLDLRSITTSKMTYYNKRKNISRRFPLFFICLPWSYPWCLFFNEAFAGDLRRNTSHHNNRREECYWLLQHNKIIITIISITVHLSLP